MKTFTQKQLDLLKRLRDETFGLGVNDLSNAERANGTRLERGGFTPWTGARLRITAAGRTALSEIGKSRPKP